MQTYRKWLIRSIVYGVLMIVLLLLVVACAPAAPAGQAGSAPATAAAPSASEITVRFWLWGLPSEAIDLVQKQVEQFSAETGVLVEFTPFVDADFIEKLQASTVAGEAPDVVGSWSYTMLRLVGGLEPLDGLSADFGLALDDFVPVARQNNSLQGNLYAIPWHRGRACAPDYTSLGIIAESQFKAESFRLIEFLTRSEQQVQNAALTYNNQTENQPERLLLPTKQSVYDELGINCPATGELIYSVETDRQRAIEIVQARSERLQPVLDENSQALADLLEGRQQTLNPAGAAPVVNYGEYTEPIYLEPETELTGKILAVAAPITLNFTHKAFQEALQRESGVIIGALFGVDEPLMLTPIDGEEFTIEPETEFALKLRATEKPNEAQLWLAVPGNEFSIGIVLFGELSANVDQPYVTVEVGSCYFSYRVNGYWIPIEFETRWAARATRRVYISLGYDVTPVTCS